MYPLFPQDLPSEMRREQVDSYLYGPCLGGEEHPQILFIHLLGCFEDMRQGWRIETGHLNSFNMDY